MKRLGSLLLVFHFLLALFVIGAAQTPAPATIQFFLPGGFLPSSELRFTIEVGGRDKLSAETDAKGAFQLVGKFSDLRIFKIEFKSDKRTYAEMTTTVHLASDAKYIPIFLPPLETNTTPLEKDAPTIESFDAKAPIEARTAHAQAMTLAKEKKNRDAIAQFTQALTIYPQHLRALNDLGIFYFTLGRLKEAEAAFTQAATLRSSYPFPRLNLAHTLISEGKNGEATIVLQSLLNDHPDLSAARFVFAELLLRGQQWDAASEEFRKLLADPKLEPGKRADSHTRLGLIVQREERYNTAIKEFEQALSDGKNTPGWDGEAETRAYLGNVFLKVNRDDEAERELKKAYELGGKRVVIVQNLLGQLYFEQQKYALALRAYELYLKETPNAANAVQVREQMEKIKEAMKSK